MRRCILMQLKVSVSCRAHTLLRQSRRRDMPFDSMLVAAAVVTMFVCFALPLAWVSRRTFGQS